MTIDQAAKALGIALSVLLRWLHGNPTYNSDINQDKYHTFGHLKL